MSFSAPITFWKLVKNIPLNLVLKFLIILLIKKDKPEGTNMLTHLFYSFASAVPGPVGKIIVSLDRRVSHYMPGGSYIC